MEKDLEELILSLTAEFEKTIPQKENEKTRMTEAFKKYLQDAVKILQESTSKFINKDIEFIKAVLKRITASISEYNLNLKKRTLLEDKAFEEIRKISFEIYEVAKKRVDGKKGRAKIDTEAKIKKMEKLLEKVEEYNKEQAKGLVSEAIIDSSYITSGKDDILSLRLYQYKKEKDNTDKKKIMDKGEKFLPIGTVVMLQNAKKRVMITGFCAIKKGDKSKVWDYSGCIYPEGFLDSNKTCLFNHDQIEKVYHLGLAEDEEEKAFKAKLNEFVKKL